MTKKEVLDYFGSIQKVSIATKIPYYTIYRRKEFYPHEQKLIEFLTKGKLKADL